MSVNKVSSTDGSLTPIAKNTSNSLSYLSDVDIISPSTGQILQYDGSKWGNGQPAYQINDTAETNLADDDKIPFYDTSASNKRSSTWSNIKAKLKSYFDSIYSTIARADAQEELLEDTVGWIGKNKVKISITPREGFVVTETDGVVSISGTNSGESAVLIIIGKATLKAGTYKLNGSVGGSSNSYGIRVSPTGTTATIVNNYTGVNSFTVDADGVYDIKARLAVSQTAYDITLRPMIYDPNLDDTFEPYHASVDESKVDNAVIAPVENGTTVQKSGGYAVGSHAIRNGAFITWKNAKAQGEVIADSDYDSGDVASAIDTVTIGAANTPHTNITLDSRNYVFKNNKSVISRVQFAVITALTGDYTNVFILPYVPINNCYINFQLVDIDNNVVVNNRVGITSVGGVRIYGDLATGNYQIVGTYFTN